MKFENGKIQYNILDLYKYYKFNYNPNDINIYRIMIIQSPNIQNIYVLLVPYYKKQVIKEEYELDDNYDGSLDVNFEKILCIKLLSEYKPPIDLDDMRKD